MILSFQTGLGKLCRLRSDCSCRRRLIRVQTVWHFVCTFWANYSMVKPHCSNFRTVKAIFRVSELFRFLWLVADSSQNFRSDWFTLAHYSPTMMWTASSEFGTYRLCEQQRFRRACASAQSRQNLRCSLIQAVSQEEPSDRKTDSWPL